MGRVVKFCHRSAGGIYLFRWFYPYCTEILNVHFLSYDHRDSRVFIFLGEKFRFVVLSWCQSCAEFSQNKISDADFVFIPRNPRWLSNMHAQRLAAHTEGYVRTRRRPDDDFRMNFRFFLRELVKSSVPHCFHVPGTLDTSGWTACDGRR